MPQDTTPAPFRYVINRRSIHDDGQTTSSQHVTPTIQRVPAALPSTQSSQFSRTPQFNFSQRSFSQALNRGTGASPSLRTPVPRRKFERVESIHDYDDEDLELEDAREEEVDLDDEIISSSAAQQDEDVELNQDPSSPSMHIDAARADGFLEPLPPPPSSSFDDEYDTDFKFANKRRRLFTETQDETSDFKHIFNLSPSLDPPPPPEEQRASSPTPATRLHTQQNPQLSTQLPSTASITTPRFKLPPSRHPSASITPISTAAPFSSPIPRPTFILPHSKPHPPISTEPHHPSSSTTSQIPLSLLLSPTHTRTSSKTKAAKSPYLPHGRAEQVRGWVLELGQAVQGFEEMKKKREKMGDGGGLERDVRVRVLDVKGREGMRLVRAEVEGEGEVVDADDAKDPVVGQTGVGIDTVLDDAANEEGNEEGKGDDQDGPRQVRKYMLLGGHHHPSSTSTTADAVDTEATKLKAGSIIEIQAGPLTWDVQVADETWSVVVGWKMIS